MTNARGHFWTTPAGVFCLLALYGLAHGMMRLSASWNLGENDPISLLRVQNFSFFEPGSHLFDGLVALASEALGPNALTFQILRYGLLTIALFFVFLSARKVTGSGIWGLLTVEAYALIYQISWRFHEGFTETLVTMIAVSGTFFALLQERFRLLWLMPFLIIGALSDFWFGLFLVGFMPAIFLSGWHRRVEVTALTVALLASIFWNSTDYMAFVQPAVGGEPLGAPLSALVKVIAFASPLLPILLVIFGWRFLVWPEDKALSAIAFTCLISTGTLVIIAAITGKADYGEHALTPVFMLLPIWFMHAIARGNPQPRRLQIFTALCILLMATAFIARAANLYVLDPVCKRCYFGIPYERLVNDLAANNPRPTLIIALDPRVAGNLKAHWPQEAMPRFQHRLKQEPITNGPTLLVWNADRYSDEQVSAWLAAQAGEDEASRITKADVISVPWPHLWRADGYRKSRFKVARIDERAAPPSSD